MKDWQDCRNMLCIRPDNMGDIVMSTPAFRALKETFHCKITLLTSAQGSQICQYVPEIDEVIIADLPWSKHNVQFDAEQVVGLVDLLRSKNFDAAIIFTVYSQTAIPSALIAFQAGIPRRLAYCRENPYTLLTDWVPDHEPYSFIRHQVERDLFLVASVGAVAHNDELRLKIRSHDINNLNAKLKKMKIPASGNIIVHVGVSEKKREYPDKLWKDFIKKISASFSQNIILTGSESERSKTDALMPESSSKVHNLAGVLTIGELIALVEGAELVVSVNTAVVHIAAAVKTPVVVLYANTNPQHTPWKVPSLVLPFSVPSELKSRSPVISHVSDEIYKKEIALPRPSEIENAMQKLLQGEIAF